MTPTSYLRGGRATHLRAGKTFLRYNTSKQMTDNKYPVFTSLVSPKGMSDDEVQKLLQNMKPFKTTVTVQGPDDQLAEFQVVMSLPPEFDDDFGEWHSDHIDLYCNELEFLMKAEVWRSKKWIKDVHYEKFAWTIPVNVMNEVEYVDEAPELGLNPTDFEPGMHEIQEELGELL